MFKSTTTTDHFLRFPTARSFIWVRASQVVAVVPSEEDEARSEVHLQSGFKCPVIQATPDEVVKRIADAFAGVGGAL